MTSAHRGRHAALSAGTPVKCCGKRVRKGGHSAMIQETKGRFGFHLIGDEDRRYPLHLNVQFYVKSSALSRSADLAISPHLATDTEIDQFVDEAIAALQAIRVDAKRALAVAYEG
jgi:TPP-dependent pyruvate/acetoin dehydrogenase alpha subunit